VRITKRVTFEAHHKLPWHKGKCARHHGHSYVLEVTFAGPVQAHPGATTDGMVVDFGDISAFLKPLVADYLDHHSLNDILDNPTAEHLVLWLVGQITARNTTHAFLDAIRLYETADSWVDWRASDADLSLPGE
jgi:6-pyruvoyltetrahydropterin/6-carboxytetrahydropterin synthase